MSKIICDICGTAYPETAAQCPICGTAKSETARTSAVAAATEEGNDYTYVKGGRFSHSNVKKRNANQELPRTAASSKPQEGEGASSKPPRRRREEDDSGSNTGLIIIAVILVLAIVAACAFVAIRFMNSGDDPANPTGTHATGTTGSQQPTQIPCTGLTLTLKEYTFTQPGDTVLLNVKAQPENTTDTVTFESSDPYIATVDASGKVIAVANGTVTITIRCGAITETCEIICNVGIDPTYPTEPPAPTEPTEPAFPDYVLEIYDPLGQRDITLVGYGSKHDFYKRGDNAPAREDIIWTSDNETVATIENGVVTAVGNGKATITAEYNGQKITVIVRCNNVEGPKEYEVRTIYGPASDISIKVGESLTLQLVHSEDGRRVPAEELTFTVQKEGYVTVDEKGRVTGLDVNYGGVWVYIEYEGVTYKCLVRVHPKPEN